MFYVNDEPEGTFLYTETIKLYCIVNSHGGFQTAKVDFQRPGRCSNGQDGVQRILGAG